MTLSKMRETDIWKKIFSSDFTLGEFEVPESYPEEVLKIRT